MKKIQFDAIVGVYEVDEFDEEVEIVPHDMIKESLKLCGTDEEYGAEVSYEEFEEIKAEYGIMELKGK